MGLTNGEVARCQLDFTRSTRALALSHNSHQRSAPLMLATEMTATEPFDADAVLRVGRDAYTEKRHRKALEAFTRVSAHLRERDLRFYITHSSHQVMKRCPCARNMKRDRCHCKNFEAVAAKKGSIFHEAMYTCSCTVGKMFNKCDATNHIRALDYRAATFEAMGELDRARLDAEWLLELAPRLPEVSDDVGSLTRTRPLTNP